ncbi:MAG TPA: hypothetical protein VIJ78_02335 [Pseudolabrys sp.]
MLAAALATGVAFAMIPSTASAFAGDNTAKITDPGFVPNSGQINQGFDEKVPTTSRARPIPSLAEARAAKMKPDNSQPSLGEQTGPALPSKSTMSQATKEGQATAGGPQAVNADANAMQNGAQDSNGKQPQGGTAGAAGQDNASQASNTQGTPSQGPIGATTQTMPAKFSQRNDILDRVPTMSWLLPLGDAYRQQIYQAVMADKTSAVSDDNKLAPATALNIDQALNEIHPLPASVSGMPGLQSLGYVKTKNKVFLVEPATRTVVDEIGS